MNEEKSLKISILEQFQTLVSAGFGLVAALAWNTAIQDLFKLLFKDQSSLVAKFLYAITVTFIVVILTHRISKLISKLKQEL